MVLQGGAPPVDVSDPIKVTIVGGVESQTYSNQMRDQFREVRQVTLEQFDLPRVADLDVRVNTLAARFKSQNKRWPNASELLAYDPYINSILVMKSGMPFSLPPLFTTKDDNGTQQWVLNNPMDGPQVLDPFAISAITSGDPNVVPGIPFILDPAQLVADFQAIRQPSAGPGRGAVGRSAIVFDRAELTEGATERWRGMLLEPPDDAAIDGLVSDYMKDANAFWMKEAGRRDFDTFVLDRIRQQPRYNYLYSKKPGFQSEAEYMTGFRNVVAGAGVNPTAGLREIEAGASSGAGLAGFGERVSRTREARLVNVGGFGNQLAQNMAASGLGRT